MHADVVSLHQDGSLLEMRAIVHLNIRGAVALRFKRAIRLNPAIIAIRPHRQ
jgi:hypothetical protein